MAMSSTDTYLKQGKYLEGYYRGLLQKASKVENIFFSQYEDILLLLHV